MCVMMCVMIMSCAPKIIIVPIAKVPTKITSYPLVDNRGMKHKYRKLHDSFIFPHDIKTLTQYCAFHHQWEDIKALYGKDENDNWGYSYMVMKNSR